MNGINLAALLRAARGPVILIVFGVLLAIDHAGVGLTFWRTWPLLVIVYGVWKLLERVTPGMPADYTPPPPAPPAAGRMP